MEKRFICITCHCQMLFDEFLFWEIWMIIEFAFKMSMSMSLKAHCVLMCLRMCVCTSPEPFALRIPTASLANVFINLINSFYSNFRIFEMIRRLVGSIGIAWSALSLQLTWSRNSITNAHAPIPIDSN